MTILVHYWVTASNMASSNKLIIALQPSANAGIRYLQTIIDGIAAQINELDQSATQRRGIVKVHYAIIIVNPDVQSWISSPSNG